MFRVREDVPHSGNQPVWNQFTLFANLADPLRQLVISNTSRLGERSDGGNSF